jgi:hypothetical protein
VVKIPSTLVIVGAIAAAVFMTGIVSTLGLQEAYAANNNNNCNNDNEGVNVGVCANVGPVCATVAVISKDASSKCD